MQIIKTPIKTESIATTCAVAVTTLATSDEKKDQLWLNMCVSLWLRWCLRGGLSCWPSLFFRRDKTEAPTKAA
jgi:hypothetical protein